MRTQHNKSRRGFAAMDPKEQREIARMGGRASHGGRGRDYDDNGGRDYERYSSRSHEDYDEEEDEDQHDHRSGRRGFAAMDPSLQRKIASKGGKASHRSSHRGH